MRGKADETSYCLFKFEYISESCCWKVSVGYSIQNHAYTEHSPMYGDYRKESTFINGKPHYTSMFDSGSHAIWFNNIGSWMIGYSKQQRTNTGFAYNSYDYNDCPYYPGYDWKYAHSGNWYDAGEGLKIWNEC